MKKNIIVSGSHRSATTWTGKVIAKAPRVGYISEPFNIDFARCNSPLEKWFEHVDCNGQKEFGRAVEKYLDSFFPVLDKNYIIDTIKYMSTDRVVYFLKELERRLLARRSVIKDPIAIMSLEWIYKTFGWDVVVLIRHPAAFIASLKVKGWYFNFDNFLTQKILMNTYLEDFKEQIIDFSNNKKNIIDQGILLWNAIYHTVSLYQDEYADQWYFIKHEDLSIDPIKEFEDIFSFLNLPFTNRVENYIVKTTKSNTNSRLKRNTFENIKTWKKRLSESEIKKIKRETKFVWEKYYSEEDW